MAEQQVDVIVVGAGMVGLAGALKIKRACPEFRVALVAPREQAHAEALFDPRVVALTQASRALLEELNVWDALVAERVCPYQHMHVWDGEGSGSIDFDSAALGAEALGYIVENRLIVRYLTRELERSGVIRYEAEASALLSLGSHVGGVALEGGLALRAPVTLAADGARSRLRDWAGLAVREWSYGQTAIVTSVRTKLSHGFAARQRFMQSGPLAFLPLRESDCDSTPRHCSIVWSADQALADELMALDEGLFAERLAAAFEHRLGAVEWVAERYPLALYQRHARAYVRPGFALLGDAAHSIHPLAGQGVNLGFLDVVSLARELERARQRQVPLEDVATLRRYERERMGHNLTMMATMEGFKRLFGARSLPALLLRNRGMSAVNNLPTLKTVLAKEAMGLSL